MTNSVAIRVSAVMGFLAVALGAFGAHGLQATLAAHNMTEVWKTAVFYHFIHTVMMFLLGQRQPVRTGPWLCFLIGIALFSGSLYLLALTDVKWLGAITPFGGLSFLAGWGWLAIGKRDGAK
jgi:uncharacterized membrane protein YgdD (TMEM256/DUF423 family)